MSSLVLLTRSFPYGGSEAYLETELPYLCKRFDEVVIFSLNVKPTELDIPCREVPKNTRVVPVPFLPKVAYLLMSPRCLLDGNYRAELLSLLRAGKLNTGRLAKLTIFVTRARHEAAFLRRMAADVASRTKNGVLYAYRMDYQPYVAILLKKEFAGWPLVARGHGYDLYEERNQDGYIPFRRLYSSEINLWIAISEHGRKYMEKYNSKDKVLLSHLGTTDYGIGPYNGRKEILRIVSCSNIIPVKRVILIAKALSKIDKVYVKWTHFGDGELMQELSNYCEENLCGNVKVKLRGFLPNMEVLSEYVKTQFDVFVNVSEDEGLPVSIMEAMSFGIPCIATDVGGNSEIVKNGRNGLLLRATSDATDVANALLKIFYMDENEYKKMRRLAREEWSDKYEASKNYSRFCDLLQSI